MSQSSRLQPQSPRFQQLKGTALAVVAITRGEQLTFLAAAIAYYAFVSLIPLAILTIAVATAIGGEAFAQDVSAMLGETLTPASQDVLASALSGGQGRASATFVGLLFLVWSGLKVFRALDRGFSAVYGTTHEEGFVEGVKEAVMALAAVGLAGLVAAGLIALIGLVDLPAGSIVGPALSILALAIAFFPLYYLFPDVHIGWREAAPGAIFAAVAWTVMGVGFGIYAERAAATNVYGFFGAVLLLVSWLYLGAMVLLLGAALNATLGARTEKFDPELAADVDRHLQSAGIRQDEPTEDDA
ncbi:YihY/virulence factor BrkB family protein [Haloarchaeobius sp. DFWS5]|uniref:YihY/virulence factor BrkB family protein n=1 Tax=Haloarchaeobius sp. DFWS5 TaxID=3446114 RepID=UPI003EBD0904